MICLHINICAFLGLKDHFASDIIEKMIKHVPDERIKVDEALNLLNNVFLTKM
jgi:hypothetical protein